MKIVIRQPRQQSSRELRDHVKTSVGLSLGRFAPRIHRVTVRFTEVSAGWRCQVEVKLPGRSFSAEETNPNRHEALGITTARVARSVGLALEGTAQTR